jgi:hypothetical protein
MNHRRKRERGITEDSSNNSNGLIQERVGSN